MRSSSETGAEELLDPTKLLFYRTELSDQERAALFAMFAQPGDIQARIKNVHFLLCLLHDAMTLDRRRYLAEVYLPWTGLIRRTLTNREAILSDIENIGSPTDRGYARRLVGIYRSIVAELLDPYLTLATATLQFLENKFQNIDDANVALSERSKAEFIAARDRFSELLSGYEPLVRNAASHPGSHGVTYRDDSIVFKDISRSSNYKVRRIELTHSELRLKIDALNECIYSFDLAENIFGLDCSELMLSEAPTYLQFLHQHSSPELREDLRSRSVEATREAAGSNSDPGAVLAAAMDTLIFNYEFRQMPFTAAITVSPGRMVIVVPVPVQHTFANDQEILVRVNELLRYGIVAVGGVGDSFKRIDVLELSPGQPPASRLLVGCDGGLLCEYAAEKAGLVDLLAECVVFLRGEKLEIGVDFDRVHEAEQAMLGEPFPRKVRSRPGGMN